MNFRFTIILFLAVLLALGGMLIYTLQQDDAPTDELLLADLAGLKFENITTLELTRTKPEQEKLVMVKTGKDRWEFRDTNAGRIDLAAVNRIVEPLLKMKPVPAGELSDDPARHGLAPPTLTLTLRTDNQRSATLLVGDTTIGGESAVTFVAAGDRPSRPVAVRRSDLAGLFRDGTKDGPAWQNARWASDFRLRRLFAADVMDPVTQAKSLKITHAGKELLLSRNGSEWQFDQPANYGLVDVAGSPDPSPDAITGLRGLMVTLSAMSAFGPDDFIENPESLEKYGLAPDDPALTRVELVPADGPPDVLLIGKQVEGSAPVKYYAQVPGERCVVKVLGDRLPALQRTVADPRPLQDRTLVRELDSHRIDAVDVAAGGTQVQLRQMLVESLKRWVIYGPGEPMYAGPAVQAMLAEIARPRAAEEALPGMMDAMFAPADIQAEIRFWFDAIPKPADPKADRIPAAPELKGPPALTFIVGKTEGETTYLRRIRADGTRTDFKIPSSLGTQLAKKRFDYFDLKFKEFATSLARKLKFNRGTEQYELDRLPPEPDFPTGKWTFAQPDSLKGQTADADLIGGSQMGAGLLGTLATLSAASVVSETPSEAELKSWGLDPQSPRIRVTVTLDTEKNPERVYSFGSETADKAFVYFRPEGSQIVYLVPRVGIDLFATGDLRDRTPYRFETRDVKRIRLRGWKGKPGVQELLLERRGDTWAAAAPEGFAVNPQSVALLMNHFRAPRPVAVVGQQAPEHGFAGEVPENDPLEVTFFGDAGEIVHLNIGRETDDGGNYFAWNSATNEVVKLPAALFRQFKQGSDFFKK